MCPVNCMVLNKHLTLNEKVYPMARSSDLKVNIGDEGREDVVNANVK